MTHPTWSVFEYQLVAYRRVWRGTVFSSFLLPVLFFIAMGLTVGSYVDRAGSLGVHYLGGFIWTRVYHSMRATPLRIGDIVAGQIGYVLLRVLLSSVGFLTVMSLFGTVHSWRGLATLPVVLLVGLAIAGPVFGYSASISSDGLFPVLFRFAIIPMTLFAGVFFPVGSMPFAARLLAYVSPLWHGVELCRAATLGTPTAWGVGAHVGYLILWAAGGFGLAVWRFRRRLTD